MLVDAVWAATWPHDRLVFGASRLIRDADRAVPGGRITAHANRGLAGIDGTVGTALGIAIASQSPRPATTVQQMPPRSRPSGSSRASRAPSSATSRCSTMWARCCSGRRAASASQLIVGNDGGGTIFDALEVAASAAPDAFDRVQFTPHHVDLATLAAAYGWDYARARLAANSRRRSPPRIDGPQIVEVPLRR